MFVLSYTLLGFVHSSVLFVYLFVRINTFIVLLANILRRHLLCNTILQDSHHDESCLAGVARTSIRNGDIQK